MGMGQNASVCVEGKITFNIDLTAQVQGVQKVEVNNTSPRSDKVSVSVQWALGCTSQIERQND